MKAVILFTFFLAVSFISLCQQIKREHTTFDLIYDTAELQRIIPQMEMLNEKYRKKNTKEKHYSLEQATAIYIHLEQPDCKEAFIDLENNIPIDEFICKYPDAQVERNVLVTLESDKDYKGETEVQLTYVDPKGDFNDYIKFDEIEKLPASYKYKTLYKYYDSDVLDSQLIEAFYFLEDFHAAEIPGKYNRMINYTNFIFDTAFKVYYKYGESFHYPPVPNTVDSFLSAINKRFGIISGNYNYYFDDEIEKKYISKDRLNDIRHFIDSSASAKQLFQRAIDSALSTHYSKAALEYLVEKLVSGNTALELKRWRQPSRSCGNDNAPKIQDYKIAALALKQDSLQLFLRAHEYVMMDRIGDRPCNNRFCYDRFSYLNELEFIHLNTRDYFYASYLSTQNNNNSYKNKYYKCFEVYDFNNRDAIEKELLNAISDPGLDLFNRLSLAKLFAKYCLNETDHRRQQQNIARLGEAVAAFPSCIKFDYDKYLESLRRD